MKETIRRGAARRGAYTEEENKKGVGSETKRWNFYVPIDECHNKNTYMKRRREAKRERVYVCDAFEGAHVADLLQVCEKTSLNNTWVRDKG